MLLPQIERKHEQLEEALARLDWALRDHDLHTARLHLEIFAAGLDRYVSSEERMWFPVFDRMEPAHRTSTTKMRREHGSLRRLVARVSKALDSQDERGKLGLLGDLRSVFLLHVAKEEMVIYPVLRQTEC